MNPEKLGATYDVSPFPYYNDLLRIVPSPYYNDLLDITSSTRQYIGDDNQLHVCTQCYSSSLSQHVCTHLAICK